MSREIIDNLDKAKIGIASGTYEIVGLPADPGGDVFVRRGFLFLPLSCLVFGRPPTFCSNVHAGSPHQRRNREHKRELFSVVDPEFPRHLRARPTVTATGAYSHPPVIFNSSKGSTRRTVHLQETNAQFALNQTTKIALATRLMVQFITQPYTHNRLSSGSLRDTIRQRPWRPTTRSSRNTS